MNSSRTTGRFILQYQCCCEFAEIDYNSVGKAPHFSLQQKQLIILLLLLQIVLFQFTNMFKFLIYIYCVVYVTKLQITPTHP